ncbi:MAG: hypothetical protein EZS28_055352, partial [Streblomastix strix]
IPPPPQTQIETKKVIESEPIEISKGSFLIYSNETERVEMTGPLNDIAKQPLLQVDGTGNLTCRTMSFLHFKLQTEEPLIMVAGDQSIFSLTDVHMRPQIGVGGRDVEQAEQEEIDEELEDLQTNINISPYMQVVSGTINLNQISIFPTTFRDCAALQFIYDKSYVAKDIDWGYNSSAEEGIGEQEPSDISSNVIEITNSKFYG